MSQSGLQKRENGNYFRDGRSRDKRSGRMPGWLRAVVCVLAAVVIADFGLFLGFRADAAEGGTEKFSQEAIQADQKQRFEEMPAVLPVDEKPAPVLLDDPLEEQLCIGVLPTETGGIMKYYVPDAQTQQELYDRISSMDVTRLDVLKQRPRWIVDAWDYNITVKYGEYSLYLCEGGVMKIDRISKDYTSFDEWAVIDQTVADYILGIVEKEIGISPFDTASISSIVRAEVMTGPLYASDPKGSIVLSDPEKLAELEDLLSGAEKSFWSKCPFGNCQLVLTTAAGEEIVLAMACDSCTVFYADGCFYDYMPEEYRGSDGEHPHNNIFYDLFGVKSEYFLNW